MIPASFIITLAVTALYLAAVPLFVLDVQRRARAGEAVEGRQLLSAILAVGWLVLVHATFIEPSLLAVKRYPVAIGEGARSLKVAVVSDIHLGLYKNEPWLEKVVARVNAEQPDLVLLGGDFVTVAAGLESLAPLADLESLYGTYAVLGNWDYRVGAVDVRRRVEQFRVEVLTNESVVIGPETAPIHLIGLDDYIYGDPNWSAALAEVPALATTIVLGHEPDFAPAAEANGLDLVVSGHTHGGQVRLPGLGAVPPLPIILPQDFDQGLFTYGQAQLFITSGVGESGARVRLFNAPEISILELSY